MPHMAHHPSEIAQPTETHFHVADYYGESPSPSPLLKHFHEALKLDLSDLALFD